VDSFWVLGDAFLLNYLTIFDLDSNKIGFIGANASFKPHSWLNEALLLTLFFCLSLILLLLLHELFLKLKHKPKPTIALPNEQQMQVITHN